MFGIEPLARIVRHDARIEVKVPAAKGKKAYSYFREGGEGEKKSSGVGKKAALIGGGLALAGLGAAAIAMSRKKTETGGVVAPVSETGGVVAPVSEPKKVETYNTARNVVIGAGVAGLGVAAKIATSKEKEAEKPKVTEKQEPKDKTESLEDIAKKPDTAHVQLVLKSRNAQQIKNGQALSKEDIEAILNDISSYKVSDYNGMKDTEGLMKFTDRPTEDSDRETYINVIIPKGSDLLTLSDKKTYPTYSIRSRLEKSGGLVLGDPKDLYNLNGLERFGHV